MEYEGNIYLLNGTRQKIYTGDEGGIYSNINSILGKFEIPSIYSESEVEVSFLEFSSAELINEDGTLSDVDLEVYKKILELQQIEVSTNAEEFIEIDEEGTAKLSDRIANNENKKV